VLLVAGLLTGIAGGVVRLPGPPDRITPALLDPDATLSQVSPSVNRPPGSVADIAKRVLPVVVSVEVSTSGGSGTGSGVVISGRATCSPTTTWSPSSPRPGRPARCGCGSATSPRSTPGSPAGTRRPTSPC
jgi:hypothetical protein